MLAYLLIKRDEPKILVSSLSSYLPCRYNPMLSPRIIFSCLVPAFSRFPIYISSTPRQFLDFLYIWLLISFELSVCLFSYVAYIMISSFLQPVGFLSKIIFFENLLRKQTLLFLIMLCLEYNCFTMLCFCGTMKRISYMYTYIPSFFDLPPPTPILPIQVIAEHPVELPVLYNNFPLAILHTVVYVCQSQSFLLSKKIFLD